MSTLISILIIIAAILLILIVMIQNSKGGGLDMSSQAANYIGNSNISQTDTIEKVTWYLAGTIGVLCLLSAYLYSNNSGGSQNIKSGISAPTTTSTPADVPAQ
jgi:preprotein translocase subunit SecG